MWTIAFSHMHYTEQELNHLKNIALYHNFEEKIP